MIAGLTLFPQQIRPVPTDASVWEWAPMSIETNQIVDSFFVRHHKFPSDVLISKYIFYANKNCRRINVGQWKKWHSVKSFWFINHDDFSFTSRYPQDASTSCQNMLTEHWLISPSLGKVTDKPDVYGERQSSHYLRCPELPCSITSTIVLFEAKILQQQGYFVQHTVCLGVHNANIFMR